MAWIESHQTLGNHPKLLRFARMLSVSEVEAVGHLHYLWWWCLDYAQDGDLSRYEAPELAAAAHWVGNPDDFTAALRRAGFIDEAGALHDWDDYAGKLIEQRRHHAAQKRKHDELYNDRPLVKAIRERDGDRCRYCGQPVDFRDRKGANGATYDYVDPAGPTSLENIVVACRACNAGKGQRTLEQAGYRLLPAPGADTQISDQDLQISDQDQDQHNLTLPNLTQPFTPPYSPPPQGWGGHISPQLPVENDNGSKPAKRTDADETFALFYSAYPRHEARAPAEKAWRRLTKAERQEAISAARRMGEHIRSHGIELRLVPLPATWLHQRRWDDWRDGKVPAHYHGQKDAGLSARDIYAMALETEARERADAGQ